MSATFDIVFLTEMIESLCEKQHIAVKEMLLKSGLSRNVVDNLKKGSIPSVDKIAKIANYFGCSIDYLLGRTDSPEVTGSAYINGNNNGIQAVSRDSSNITVNGNATVPDKDTLTEQFMQKFEQLDFDDKVDVMQYVKNKK